jgi:uridine phosphorylase
MTYFPDSELVLNERGQVYHLGIFPENISDKIILVGDQDRVSLIAQFLEEIEHSSIHREFHVITGKYKKKRISIISTGIGTDNIDIVINELDALKNINLESREEKEIKTSLEIVRIGTCGILQVEIPLHSYILTTFAYGLDNVAHFYPISYSSEELLLSKKISSHLQLPIEIQPYTSKSSDELFDKLSSDKTIKGITVTSSGFYGPQGRSLRLGLRTNEMNEKLTSFQYDEHRISNFEMESSALFVLGKELGHKCATICLGIANRPKNEFTKGFNQEMKNLIVYVLDRI